MQEEPRSESQRLRSILTHENGGENGKHPRLLDFTDANFVTDVLDVQDRLVVFDFWADYCVMCKFVHASIQKLQQALPGVKFGRVDVTKNPELVQAFQLKAIPHVVAVLKGEVAMEVVGDKPYAELFDRIEALSRKASPEAA